MYPRSGCGARCHHHAGCPRRATEGAAAAAATTLGRGAGHGAGERAANTPISIAHGDGIGPEIMAATLRILRAAGTRLAPETIEIGEGVYRRGNSAGIAPEAWESLRRTRVFLRAPITTPQGGGFKSLNVTVRKTLGLYASVRPCVAYAPFVAALPACAAKNRHP